MTNYSGALQSDTVVLSSKSWRPSKVSRVYYCIVKKISASLNPRQHPTGNFLNSADAKKRRHSQKTRAFFLYFRTPHFSYTLKSLQSLPPNRERAFWIGCRCIVFQLSLNFKTPDPRLRPVLIIYTTCIFLSFTIGCLFEENRV